MRSDFTVDALLVLSATGCVVDGATVFAIVVTTEGATDVLELELVVEELELLEELDAVVDGAVVDGAVVDGAVVVGAVVVGRAFIYKTAIAVSLLF
jgi:hypothetical protein